MKYNMVKEMTKTRSPSLDDKDLEAY